MQPSRLAECLLLSIRASLVCVQSSFVPHRQLQIHHDWFVVFPCQSGLVGPTGGHDRSIDDAGLSSARSPCKSLLIAPTRRGRAPLTPNRWRGTRVDRLVQDPSIIAFCQAADSCILREIVERSRILQRITAFGTQIDEALLLVILTGVFPVTGSRFLVFDIRRVEIPHYPLSSARLMNVTTNRKGWPNPPEGLPENLATQGCSGTGFVAVVLGRRVSDHNVSSERNSIPQLTSSVGRIAKSPKVMLNGER